MRPVNRLFLFYFFFFVAPSVVALDLADLPSSSFNKAEIVGSIQHSKLRELSGLNRSGVQQGRLWGINDSGAKPQLFALDEQGKNLGVFDITGAINYDWEDITILKIEETDYIVIADIGDNLARRRDYTLYFIPEPKELPADPTSQHSLPVAFHWTFQYEDGARDAESIAYDSFDNQLLILSKRDVPPKLYSLPLNTTLPSDKRIAREIAVATAIPQPNWSYLIKQPITGSFASFPTAMDISPDGTRLAVLTYRFAYLYHRQPEESWADVIEQTPQRIVFPALMQAEALTFDYSGEALFISSEFSHAPLVRIGQSPETMTPSTSKEE